MHNLRCVSIICAIGACWILLGACGSGDNADSGADGGGDLDSDSDEVPVVNCDSEKHLCGLYADDEGQPLNCGECRWRSPLDVSGMPTLGADGVLHLVSAESDEVIHTWLQGDNWETVTFEGESLQLNTLISFIRAFQVVCGSPPLPTVYVGYSIDAIHLNLHRSCLTRITPNCVLSAQSASVKYADSDTDIKFRPDS